MGKVKLRVNDESRITQFFIYHPDAISGEVDGQGLVIAGCSCCKRSRSTVGKGGEGGQDQAWQSLAMQ